MNPVLRFFFFGLFAVPLMAANLVKQPVFELRLVAESPIADSERMTILHRPAKDGAKGVPEVLNVAKGALLDDSDVKSATTQADPLTGNPQVGITFTDQGKKALAELTKTNVNKRLAILIDRKIVMAPIVRTEIKDGKAVIAGNFTEKEAKDLADRINKAVQTKEQGKTEPWKHGLYDRLDPVRPK